MGLPEEEDMLVLVPPGGWYSLRKCGLPVMSLVGLVGEEGLLVER